MGLPPANPPELKAALSSVHGKMGQRWLRTACTGPWRTGCSVTRGTGGGGGLGEVDARQHLYPHTRAHTHCPNPPHTHSHPLEGPQENHQSPSGCLAPPGSTRDTGDPAAASRARGPYTAHPSPCRQPLHLPTQWVTLCLVSKPSRRDVHLQGRKEERQLHL